MKPTFDRERCAETQKNIDRYVRDAIADGREAILNRRNAAMITVERFLEAAERLNAELYRAQEPDPVGKAAVRLVGTFRFCGLPECEDEQYRRAKALKEALCAAGYEFEELC